MPEYASIQVYVYIRNYARARAAMDSMGCGETTRAVMATFMRRVLPQGAALAKMVTHRDTGHLADSHMWEYNSRHEQGRIFINPRIAFVTSSTASTVKFPYVYGVYENARGESHAFYTQTAYWLRTVMLYEGMNAVSSEMNRLWR